ncbi:hypothetical protein CVD28_12415 [Bacillus sp. M6-12]|uniref:DUF2161 domain-containing phosphodiesterase n=1 Tax=Bacillus sp. M6-12 TaxID=2054166 RepID=UPI000C78C507|nr:DUF2161 family putative PD-(D/E)XK-type phosphodiesterase [Bacillus sp. M6-12]PLS17363.1 hypothetical protein CVD28_12415 [Bacillus sp. M6-12]
MNSKTAKILETDLYEPIRNYFTEKGYDVYAEVKHCDITAVKENELIIVEMKLNLTVDLLVQAAKRQRITDLVYIAIPRPKYRLGSKKWNDICHLIRRLELGLILVSFQKSGISMEIAISPGPFDRLKSMQYNRKKRDFIIAEIDGRNGDYNIGGSSKTKIITAYKETCIQIACLLERFGPLSPKALREMGTGDKTLSILNKNYYRWFDKIKRGTYTISSLGKKELEHFPEQVQYFYRLYDGSSETFKKK